MESRRRARDPNFQGLSLTENSVSRANHAFDWNEPIEISGGYRPFPGVAFPPTSYTSPLEPVQPGSPVIPQPSLSESPPQAPPIPVIPPDGNVPTNGWGVPLSAPIIPPSNSLWPGMYPYQADPPPMSAPPLGNSYGPTDSPWPHTVPPPSVETTREIMRYLWGLNDWLGRDVVDRQAELRGLVARVDSLTDEIRRLTVMGESVHSRQADLRNVTARVNNLSDEIRQFSASRGRIVPPVQPGIFPQPPGFIPTPGAVPPPTTGIPMPGFVPSPDRPQIKFHEMLSPPSDESTHRCLRWNLLYPSAYAQLDELDPSSWVNKREERATDPPVPMLNLVSKSFPWIISVRASHSQLGVSCADIIEAIADCMGQLVSGQDFQRFPYTTQRMVTGCYQRNRLSAREVMGVNGLGEGVKRLDWLGMETIFGGIEQNDRLVTETCGWLPPFTFSLLRIRKSSANVDL